jgi:2,3,4,5-tetrahydropyridine-2-carboxylate N-succinyltransferase
MAGFTRGRVASPGVTHAHLDSPAWGLGLATVTTDGQVLDTWFPAERLGLGDPPAMDVPAGAPLSASSVFHLPLDAITDQPLPGLRTVAILVVVNSLAAAPKDAFEVYLRLHLLSHRMVRPHQANLEGIFGLLTNVAWTSVGPCPPERIDELRMKERIVGRRLAVYGVDKFPRMTDYVLPSGVRIADADRVRLGAHPAPGTTVMHEGLATSTPALSAR